ncbi:MFS transporter [Chryseolinea sp. H1M3-3]|uniref:MFS transporter n=1 Tax=Chryseolinea sp. H1M3-3 TaxID=3034144 RepID=UPI0023EC1635|nr:MFS transporter [Chryseolinea sp. H1M3-3]
MNTPSIQLGLKENWKQFSILVFVNAFVGGMVGLERTIIPQIAEADFGMAAKTAILSFIVVFGITKAITNYYTGILATKFGRKRLLVVGWLFALPVPVMLMEATSWNWIIAANILLGINQGLAWSSTVVMKIDLVGEKNRGFAMGLNEFAGYIALAVIAYVTGWIAHEYGLRPYPFYVGIGLAIVGLTLSVFFVKDTDKHVLLESTTRTVPKLKNVFWETTWKHKDLGSVTQAGLVNNLNDGMVWGLFPLLLASKGFNLNEIGIIVATYPAVWGMGQLFTGSLADKYCKRTLLFWGMFLQGFALVAMIWANSFLFFIVLSALLGVGTAIVYPTFLAAVSDYTHPHQRPQSIGIFRLWRDLGYAIGAILTGLIADQFGLIAPVLSIGLLTIASSVIVQYRMGCSKKTFESKRLGFSI